MSEALLALVAAMAGSLAAYGLVLAALAGLRITRPMPDGLMHYFFFALLLSNGIAVLVSTRNFDVTILIDTELSSNPVAAWAVRLTSLLALLGAADQIARRFAVGASFGQKRLLLIFALLLFWLCSIPVPAYLSAHRTPIELSWCYTPILSAGLLMLSQQAASRCVDLSRNAIVAFCAAGLLLIAVKPNLVLQSNYMQGYLGIPRFAGLAPHAISMGLIACVGLWCLMARPLSTKSRQWTAIAICLVALFLAQSKTVWISFLLTLPIMVLNGREVISFNGLTRSKHRDLIVVGAVFGGLLVVAVAAFLIFGDFDRRMDKLLVSDEGSRIMTATGRDRIWEVALAEWRHSPIFGYGLPLFGPEHQFQIGMSFATSGHNQLFDSLGRTGLVGTASMILYTGCLLYFGWKYRRASGGFSAVLVITTVLRMLSEVPLTLGSLSPQSISHYLLLVTIAMGLPSGKDCGGRQGART